MIPGHYLSREVCDEIQDLEIELSKDTPMKKKLRIGIIDLVAQGPTRALFARLMYANLASIMPQVVAAWCEAEGHEVEYVCYTGPEDLLRLLPDEVNLLFVCAFTEAAQLAYAVSHYYRSKNAVTVIGGPHARCYPEDAQQYFDYVLGFTDRELLRDVLADASPHRPLGLRLQAGRQPTHLPGVQERWKFIALTLRKAPWIQVVPMLGSLGCPYTCSFCIDATVPYQPMDFTEMRDDLRFLRQKFKRPIVAWHDPNFGVRFTETLATIEEAVPPGSVHFIAESSLSILSEPHVQRMSQNGFKALLPGIESWFDLGAKSKVGRTHGLAKVRQIADHVSMILRHIPYVQTNFVLGLDADEGPEPFELTKRFVDQVPAAFPGFSLLTSFGCAAPANLEYQQHQRVLPFPFHLLNNNHAMNVRPKNYSWPSFYNHVIDLVSHTFSWPAVAKRFQATKTTIPRVMNFVRAVSSEGWGRRRYHMEIRRQLDTDVPLRRYFEGESDVLPQFYHDMIRKDLGPLWAWLPEGALSHDPYAYLRSHSPSSFSW
jgi:hypothetical protein